MKLTIKTLQQSTLKIDFEPDKTVKELKEKIEKDHGKDYPSGSQKLIYNGKILVDESKLEEYEIDEKKFIVLMITRPPPVVKPNATKQTASTVKKEESSATSTGASKPVKEDKVGSSNPNGGPNVTTRSSASTTAAQNPPSTVTTSANNTSASSQERTAGARQVGGATMQETFSMSDPQVASRLAALMSDPHFRQMQDVIQQTPQLLSSRIEELSTTNPEMYSFISENPDAFVNMLNHPPVAGSRSSTTGRGSVLDGGQSNAGQTREHRHAPAIDQTFLADVSEHDKEAIERLKELGFSEYLAIQAYMACEKDEQLAANLLFQMEQ